MGKGKWVFITGGGRGKEVFGVIYERFSVGRKLSSFGVKHDIKTVLEMPAHGAKAMPSIYSLGFGTCAQKITLVNGNPKYISEWKRLVRRTK